MAGTRLATCPRRGRDCVSSRPAWMHWSAVACGSPVATHARSLFVRGLRPVRHTRWNSLSLMPSGSDPSGALAPLHMRGRSVVEPRVCRTVVAYAARSSRADSLSLMPSGSARSGAFAAASSSSLSGAAHLVKGLELGLGLGLGLASYSSLGGAAHITTSRSGVTPLHMRGRARCPLATWPCAGCHPCEATRTALSIAVRWELGGAVWAVKFAVPSDCGGGKTRGSPGGRPRITVSFILKATPPHRAP